MQIGVGYKLTYNLPQSTPMLLTVNIHYSRTSDLVMPDHLVTFPAVPVIGYRDLFGNWISRIVAPAGQIRLSAYAIVRDIGQPDQVCPSAIQHAVQALPEETLVFLLGSRYCDTDRLSEIAWNQFGRKSAWVGTRPGDLRLRAPSSDIRLPVRASHADGFRSIPGAPRRVPGLRPPGDHVVSLLEYPGALLHRIPGRYRNSACRGTNGLFRLV